MRHGPNKHGEHAHEETDADGEVRFTVLDGAARAEVLLPSIVVGREREPLAPGRHLTYFERLFKRSRTLFMSTMMVHEDRVGLKFDQ